MVDQINQSIDIVVPFIDTQHEDKDKKIVEISGNETNERPLYQITRKRYIKIIRRQLKAKHRLLLKAYNSYAYYSCHTTEMKQKVVEHMKNTNAYSFLMKLNRFNQYNIHKYMDPIFQQITRTMHHLLYHRSITYSQWQKITVNRNKTRLDTLYFLPDTHKENVPFRPMMDCHHSLTIHLARFLTHLLQPIYNRVSRSTTFNTGADAIYAIEEYDKKGFLQSNTLFATVYIHDLCTIFPHEQTIEILQHFLHEYILEGQIQGITIQTILQLVRLILTNQYFRYEHKLYIQTKGSNYNSPLTMLLANIYMYYWQKELVEILVDKNEVFGRCLDQIFITWNESEDRLRLILNTINNSYPHMQMTISIGDNSNYLDAQISHTEGDLQINIAHEINTEPYSLPFIYGHRRNNYLTLIRAALIRTVQCCAHVYQFHNECEAIQSTFSLNGFSSNFIRQEMQLFFIEFNVHALQEEYDQHLYDQLRQRIRKLIP